jgi:hypothetical protein
LICRAEGSVGELRLDLPNAEVFVSGCQSYRAWCRASVAEPDCALFDLCEGSVLSDCGLVVTKLGKVFVVLVFGAGIVATK